MKKINYKSRKGFTLIELLVVIGILAVLAAIAIPSVAGLIDRANVSADNTNSTEYTNAIERFVSEYEMYRLDVQSGLVDPNNLSASQSRVYNVLGTANWENIKLIENGGCNSIVLDQATKYPLSKTTVKKIIENYGKTSSSTFDPKQSDKHYFYCPSSGAVVTADMLAQYDTLNAKLVNGTDGNGNALTYQTEWIDLTGKENILYSIMAARHNEEGQTTYYFYFPEAQYNRDTQKLTIQTPDGAKTVKKAIMIRTNEERMKEEGQTITLDGVPEDKKTYFTTNNSTVSTLSQEVADFVGMRDTGYCFAATYNTTNIEERGDLVLLKRMVFEMDDGSIYYSQTFYTTYNDAPSV